MFSWKEFSWDGSGKFRNTRRKGTDQENSKKQEGKNGGKKNKRFMALMGLSLTLVLEPPLQQKLVDTCFYLTILG
jgi:hypothetical protein